MCVSLKLSPTLIPIANTPLLPSLPNWRLGRGARDNFHRGLYEEEKKLENYMEERVTWMKRQRRGFGGLGTAGSVNQFLAAVVIKGYTKGT